MTIKPVSSISYYLSVKVIAFYTQGFDKRYPCMRLIIKRIWNIATNWAGKLLSDTAYCSRSSYQKLEDVIGCEWSVLTNVGKDIHRPGELERSIEGISTKVLSERFRKLVEYGLLDKRSFKELPPRTEYYLTEKGSKVVEIILQIKALDGM